MASVLTANRAELQSKQEGALRLWKPHKYEKFLIVLFLLTLPLSNPWVRGDGVGYYAYARAMLIEHHLDFQNDWKHGNESFAMGRLDARGNILPDEYTSTGHIANLWAIGPSLLWFPFLFVTHLGVSGLRSAWARTLPRTVFRLRTSLTMAFATALYGFLGLVAFLRSGPKIFRRTLGVPRNDRHLVGQLAPGLHVFQSFVVPCALRLRRGALPVVLGSHARRTNHFAVDSAGPALRAYRRCLLPERRAAHDSAARRNCRLLDRLQIARLCRRRDGAALPASFGLCRRIRRGSSAHADHQANHFW